MTHFHALPRYLQGVEKQQFPRFFHALPRYVQVIEKQQFRACSPPPYVNTYGLSPLLGEGTNPENIQYQQQTRSAVRTIPGSLSARGNLQLVHEKEKPQWKRPTIAPCCA